jgi:uncharacterized phage protein (TIGR02218 family)
VTRADGAVLGFTDHDRDLVFDGITFRAESGLTARALQTATGLAVDNSEAVGALSSDAVSEVDILAGRYDGAEVKCWLVNWQDVTIRAPEFRGTIGEIGRVGGAFTAELRGMTEALNRPRGRIYQSRCTAVLGDERCGVDLNQPGLSNERGVESVEGNRVFAFSTLNVFPDRFFEKGQLRILTGRAAGLTGVVKNDRLEASGRRTVELWQRLGLEPEAGDQVRIEAGCDKRADTCKLKFANFLNFQGFPAIPGEDWLMAFPSRGGLNDGGSMNR